MATHRSAGDPGRSPAKRPSSRNRGPRGADDPAPNGAADGWEAVARSDGGGRESVPADPDELRGEWLPGLPTAAALGRPATLADEPAFAAEAGFGVAAAFEDGFGFGGGFGTRRVFGRDDRVRVLDTGPVPYRQVCFLAIEAGDGTPLAGTGWLAGPRTVVTAGHCVFDRRFGGWARAIAVFPGRNAADAPLRSGEVDLHAVSAWTQNPNPPAAVDFGAITLNEPLGEEVGWLGFADLPDDELRRHRLSVVGYPGDKPPATMWAHAERVNRVRPQTLEYFTDTYRGQSGSPVLARDGDAWVAVGVHNSGPATGNVAARVNAPVFEQLAAWVDSAGGD